MDVYRLEKVLTSVGYHTKRLINGNQKEIWQVLLVFCVCCLFCSAYLNGYTSVYFQGCICVR